MTWFIRVYFTQQLQYEHHQPTRCRSIQRQTPRRTKPKPVTSYWIIQECSFSPQVSPPTVAIVVVFFLHLSSIRNVHAASIPVSLFFCYPFLLKVSPQAENHCFCPESVPSFRKLRKGLPRSTSAQIAPPNSSRRSSPKKCAQAAVGVQWRVQRKAEIVSVPVWKCAQNCARKYSLLEGWTNY